MSEKPIDLPAPVEAAPVHDQAPLKTGNSPAPSGDASTATNINSMADLKEKAPKVHDEMMKGLAMSMIRQINRRHNRLKKMWRETRDA